MLGGPHSCTLEVWVGRAAFFCCSAQSLQKSYSISKSTSSKTGNYFLYHHLALSQGQMPRLHPCHQICLNLMHSLLEFQKILLVHFWVGSKKPQLHRQVKISLEHSCVVVMISVGCFLCTMSPTSITQNCVAHLWNGGPGHLDCSGILQEYQSMGL